MKTTALRTREIVAWIVLICAAVLFSFSISFAQDSKQAGKSEIKIRIQKDENGKKTKIDTTITSDQLPALKEYLKDLDIDFDADAGSWDFSDKGLSGSGNMTMRFRHPEMSKEDREAFEKDMEKLKEEMNDLDHELKDMHIEMYGFDDNDPENFDLHMKMPCPPIPPGTFKFDDGSDSTGGHGKHFNFRFHSLNDEVPDSLNNDQHIILYGAAGEEDPVLEKTITTGDGEKIFIFKRKLPKEKASNTMAAMSITKLKVYPNPGDGKISLRFNAGTKGDIGISINDANGKEVYTKTLKDFSGEYAEQIDISKKGKGTYFIKITQGDDSITKKLVVE